MLNSYIIFLSVSQHFLYFQESSIRNKVFEYLKTTDMFNGIDPFDDNISDISRMNGFIVYIMSDGKQRNLPNIIKELNMLYPDNKFTEHNIYRRIYALNNKGILVKQQMKGYYRLREDLSKNTS